MSNKSESIIAFRADDRLKERAEAYASKDDRPLSSLCRKALEHYLDTQENRALYQRVD